MPTIEVTRAADLSVVEQSGCESVTPELKRTWEALPPTSTFTTRVSVK